MYSSRGSSAYGQQSYSGQSGYGQKMGPAYSGGSAGGPDGGSQLSLASQHSSIHGALQEADVGGYRAHPSAAAHYGGQYSSVYGSAGLSGSQQLPALSNKGAGQSVLEGRSSYTSSISASPNFTSSEYVSSSNHGYGRKNEGLFAEKVPDYPSLERRQYAERQGAYIRRDVQMEPTGRFTDSVGFGHQRQSEMYDRMDQTSLLRQEHLLKTQSRHSTALDGSSRQNEYLAARVPANRHLDQDLVSYGGRMDADPQSLSMLGAPSYGGPKATSILGAGPRRNADDHVYGQSSLNPGYGVSLPPGRDYTTGKGLHGSESDYSSSILSRGSHPQIEEDKDDRASYLQEFELREEERYRERLREREREREREKERQRERERERERVREWERERERERARERERFLEKRDKEKERERKRLLETGRERTPPRASKDRRGSSLTKEGRSLRRDSPHHEASNRRPSPVKQIRREYVCKVYSSSLVAVERDYMSLDKRYPRLLVSPEFSKVVVSWPKDCVKLSLHTPVSFEHDFLEDESAAEPKESSAKLLSNDSEQPVHRDIVWNAKVILMSGQSRSALENLSSDKSFGDHVPHICNILRFAVLRKDHSFMAIGGPWNCNDGSDPSVDDSSLIQTALRYAKDITQLDLQNCQHWNRFLEIHYDRIGKDGLFSHKEITVLFVPDLSDCLPSLETWRQQWLAHKNAVADRERRRNLKDEKSGDRMEGTEDKGLNSLKDSKMVGKSEKNDDSGTSGENGDGDQKDKNAIFVQGGETEERSGKNEKKDADEMAELDKDEKVKESGETTGAQAAGTVKTGKKKIIRKIVKQKVADKKAIMEKSDGKQSDKLDKDAGDGNTRSETASKQNEPSTVVKTFIRKKVVKKVPAVKEGVQSVMKTEMETDCTEGETKEITDPDSAMVGQDSGAKTTIKRKIIKKVPKKKVVDGEANVGVADSKEDGGEQIVVKEGQMDKPVADTKSQVSEVNKLKKKVISKKKSQASVPEMQNTSKTSAAAESVVNEEEKKDEKGVEEKIGSSTIAEGKAEKQKAPEHDVHMDKSLREVESKNDKEKKDANQKDESLRKSDEDTRAKRKVEEPPRPGLILQTKGPKGSKLRSLSLSLDSLLDYSDKDAEESNFELSVFAESLYEMLQYQMGCRLFSFLQKLRTKFIKKRNERKRRREENRETGNYKKAPKQSKTFELPPESKSAILETADVSAKPEDEKTKDNNDSNDNVDAERMNEGADNNEDLEEDPEEDPEEFDEMEETTSQLETSKEATEQLENTDVNTGPEKVGGDKESGPEEPVKDEESAKDKSSATTPGSKPDHDTSAPVKGEEVGTGMKQAGVEDSVVNKELLQAFRFFDRNRVGYIRVEDMRLIIHTLGKFLCHRDVKELVACALWESNTGRDDRILYEKLVRMSDV